MSVRQYIGARYVPRFLGEFDPTQEYTALDVVDNGSGTSYIGKKNVPPGTSLLNTEYWAVYGAASGAIINLQNQIGDLTHIDPDLTNDNLVDAINDVYDVTQKLKSEVVLFGDSWVDKPHDANVYLPAMLAKEFPVTVHNYSYGGTRFDDPNGYDEQLTWFAADNIDPDTIRFIILGAGVNEYTDGTSSTDFLAKLEDWYSKLIAITGKYIPVYWFFSYSVANVYTLVRPTTYLYQYTYYHNIQVALTSPINCINTLGLVSSWRNTSHPDGPGHIALAQNICNIIKGLPPVIYPYEEIGGDMSDTALPSAFRHITARFYGEGPRMRVVLQFAKGGIGAVTSGSTITFTKNLPVQLPQNFEIDQGVLITSPAADGFTFTVINSAARIWTTSMSGFDTKEFYVFSS